MEAVFPSVGSSWDEPPGCGMMSIRRSCFARAFKEEHLSSLTHRDRFNSHVLESKPQNLLHRLVHQPLQKNPQPRKVTTSCVIKRPRTPNPPVPTTADESRKTSSPAIQLDHKPPSLDTSTPSRAQETSHPPSLSSAVRPLAEERRCRRIRSRRITRWTGSSLVDRERGARRTHERG